MVKVCNDGELCTTDACDKATGLCKSTASVAGACDDGDACTGACAKPNGLVKQWHVTKADHDGFAALYVGGYAMIIGGFFDSVACDGAWANARAKSG